MTKFITFISIFLTYVFYANIALATTESIDLPNSMSAKNASNFNSNFIVGGQPSIKDLILMAENNIQTVINLRGAREFTDFDERAKVEMLGMKYISIPVSGASEVNLHNLKLFTRAIKNNTNKTFIHCVLISMQN